MTTYLVIGALDSTGVEFPGILVVTLGIWVSTPDQLRPIRDPKLVIGEPEGVCPLRPEAWVDS